MIVTSPTITKISAALLAFQGLVEGVGKTKDNKAFGNFKYATLENVRDTAVPVLQGVGVLFLQSGGTIVDGVMAMSTRLIHAESGEWIEGTMDIALGKRDPQGVGSAQTYAQRYHLMAMLGLPPIDDDGEAAIDRDNKRPAQNAHQLPSEPLPVPAKAGLKDTAQRALWGRLVKATREVKTLAEFNALWAHPASQAAYDGFSADWKEELDAERRDKEAELREKAPDSDPTASLDRQFPGDIPLATRIAATP